MRMKGCKQTKSRKITPAVSVGGCGISKEGINGKKA